ncbi:MAG: UbiH/UbiF/VisC/COQ6 family ubiquinone biosynthesis hydroxylase [bacterium]|nr:UbiH/UbiF/VisC/COQ6 family ubiquinone biosynthesis hydroxylase [bacterium]
MESRFDICVVGGGMSGMTAALALARAGFEVALVERVPRQTILDSSFDGRVSSVSWGSKLVLERLDAWRDIAPRAQPILDIRVSDRQSPFFLHYDHRDVGDHPMGWIMENRVLRQALDSAVGRAARVHPVCAGVVAMECDDAGATLGLDDGARLRCSLVVACDGARSPLRAMAGIDAWQHDYRQTAIIATVRHSRPHNGIAHERFLAGGPFAILPLPGDRSSIVWTEDEEIARRVLEIDHGSFSEELAWRFGDFLGPLEVTGPVLDHHLSLVVANRLTGWRLALVGDAAHAIHPIAGQGFNLGIRDAAVLAEVLADMARLGLDPGTGAALAAYARRRRVDTWMLVAMTHGLNRLFAMRSPPVALARGLGLALVGSMKPVKRQLMKDAMGVAGRLPRLMTGERL